MPNSELNAQTQKLLKQRAMHRRVKKLARQSLSGVGAFLPFALKLGLGRLSSKLSYLLISHPPFIVNDYLGAYRVKIDPKSDADRALLRGDYEKDVLLAIEKNIQPGAVCIDVGANVGAVAMAMALKVGNTGKVVCFEPGPPFAMRLKETRDLNPSLLEVLEVVEMGVSNQEGKLHWEEDAEFPGNAYLFGPKGTEVPVTTLDKYFETRPLKRLDFIKIDVEGMELEVLEGGFKLISTHRPIILYETLMDFELYRERPIRKLAAELLANLGYDFFNVSLNENLAPASYPHFGANTLAISKKI